MKNSKIRLISIFLILALLVSIFASCTDVREDGSTDIAPNETTENEVNDSTESDGKDTETTENETENVDETPVIEGPNADLIMSSNSLANGVQGRYTSSTRGGYIVDNQNMSLEYNMSYDKEQLVKHIKNTQGQSYIENTMDVFVKMLDGTVVYGSGSSLDAYMNIFRFGYYYYDVRIEGQNFPGELEIINSSKLDLQPSSSNHMSTPKLSNGILTATIKNKTDPYITYNGLALDTEEYNYVQITMKVSNATNVGIMIIAGSQQYFNGAQVKSFALIPDGEFHTYTIPLTDISDYNDTLKGFRIDLVGAETKETIEISDISFVDVIEIGVPTLSMARIFHTYSDKLHHELQLVATETTGGIAEVGMITKVAANAVDKLIVKDKVGHHENIESVDWDSAEYIGFDIRNAGIFGYILPADQTDDRMTVTLEHGYYVITQSRAPEDNVIYNGEGNALNYENVSGNSNDFYMGQRIYTDENHTFDEFLKEAYIERHPLTAKNIKVSQGYSSGASFIGYDSLRGSYEFYIKSTSFNEAYHTFPNKHFNINFTVKGDEYDRLIYAVVASTSGALECSALLDENLMLLPVPMETGKNFRETGDWTIYSRFDTPYSETINPLIVTGDKTREYNIVQLYQNWGRFPLKQLSFIQYVSPYYHLSTGVTETNCLVPWRHTNSNVPNLLPDHRAMSAPLWRSQPQHTSAGSHAFLRYYDSDNNSATAELISQRIDAYGPTYADLTMYYQSTDGKINISYSHMEMPQTDENRAYYTMTYDFIEDVSFKDFKNDFRFYSLSDNNSNYAYQMFGYLDANNEFATETFSGNVGEIFTLGDNAPYFDLFKMDSTDYSNVSFLIGDYTVIINGEETDTRFAIKTGSASIDLTLDLAEVTFKAGDRIEFNAIIMPWGSWKTVYDSDTIAPDQNVRDVRENSFINPMVAIPVEDCEVVEKPFMPQVKSTNGKSAEFTVSGGAANPFASTTNEGSQHNVVVRVYGLEQLTVPIIYQKIDGEWQVYEISSAGTLDKYGYGAYYDGYNVYYDGDGTYSYSFVIDMTDGVDKTFKFTLDEDFEKWPRIIVDESLIVAETPFNFYFDDVAIGTKLSAGWFSQIVPGDSNGTTYMSVYANSKQNESQVNLFNNSENEVTGQYIVLKYRIPDDNPNMEYMVFEFFTSTVNTRATGTDSFRVYDGLICDNTWRVMVIDLAAYGKTTVSPAEDGSYTLKYVRFDPFNFKMGAGNRVDLAYAAIHSDLETIYQFLADMGEVTLVTGPNDCVQVDVSGYAQ